MRFLRTLLMLFRRPTQASEAYEEEVLFAGWVNLPPLFRELADDRDGASESYAPSTTRAITG